jgi:hypothetical protein
MVNNEYEKFYGQKVGVIVANGQSNTGADHPVLFPLHLEGILDKETENSIFLKDAQVQTSSHSRAIEFKSLYDAVPKDKIISLYLIGSWKLLKKKIEKESELIGEPEPPKPDSAKSE